MSFSLEKQNHFQVAASIHIISAHDSEISTTTTVTTFLDKYGYAPCRGWSTHICVTTQGKI
jgi:hypothetical protein